MVCSQRVLSCVHIKALEEEAEELGIVLPEPKSDVHEQIIKCCTTSKVPFPLPPSLKATHSQ